MSEALFRKRSLSKDLPAQHKHRNSASTTSISLNLAAGYPPTGSRENGKGAVQHQDIGFADTYQDDDEDEQSNDNDGKLEMGRVGGNYSQLPNGGDTSFRRKSSGRNGSDGGFASSIPGLNRLPKAQRIAAVAAAAILLVVLVVNSRTTAGSSSSGIVAPAKDISWSEDLAHNDEDFSNNGPIDKTVPRPPTDNAYATGSCILAPGKHETEYALMIDAGSTGSRMHVYTFSNCLPPGTSPSAAKNALPTLKDEKFIPITPGLSSYKGNPKAAAESLRKLMQAAVDAVPESERGCTPVAVKATAGLRLLGKKESQDILDEVERWLKEEWPFHVIDNGVVIMDGKDEGVYAWITINYLLGLVGPGKNTGASAAVMDLGGASTQIVFEPSFPAESELSPGDHVYDLDFASNHHTLYQHSHLGYGLMQARRSVHNLIAFTHIWQTVRGDSVKAWDELTESDEIPHPCLVKDGRKTVLLDPPGRHPVNVTFVGTGAGFEACRRVVDVVMAKDALCKVEPCAFGGVYQPQLMETFGHGPIYALSYFYDRIVPLGLGDKSKPFTIADLRNLSKDVCAGPHPSSRTLTKGWNRFKNNKEAMDELHDRPEYCLDLSFMYSLLSLGYELADDRELVTGKKINDIELGWALGAGIALLEHSSLQCRVTP